MEDELGVNQKFSRRPKLEPKLVMGFQALSGVSENLGKMQDFPDNGWDGSLSQLYWFLKRQTGPLLTTCLLGEHQAQVGVVLVVSDSPFG